MVKIIKVEKGSPAFRKGIRKGDFLISINGYEVGDYLDYVICAADFPAVYSVSKNGMIRDFVFDDESELGVRGLDVEDMKIRHCGNRCVFCFVDQNPPGLRKSLYMKDEDFRYSFLYGSYFTLSNIRKEELERIRRQHLSPLYISVHAADSAVRMKLLGLSKNDNFKRKMNYLVKSGITVHAQIVLCRGINDGVVLEETVRYLFSHYPMVKTLAVVPAGITDHRKNLYPLAPFDRNYACGVLKDIKLMQDEFFGTCGSRFVFPSDELFLKAGKAIPSGKYYEGYPQYENGVGMVRSYLDELSRGKKRFPESIPSVRKILIVTGVSFYPVIEKHLIPVLDKIKNLQARAVCARSSLFGKEVTVAGLLCGEDIILAVKQSGFKSDRIIIPDTCLNFDGVFLDGLTLSDVSERTGTETVLFGGFGEILGD